MTSQWQTTNEQLWSWYGSLGYVFAFLREEHILYRVTESTHKEVNQCSKAKGVTQTQQIPGSPTVAHKLHQRYIRRYDLLREVFFLSTTDRLLHHQYISCSWLEIISKVDSWAVWYAIFFVTTVTVHRRLNQFFEDPNTEKVKEPERLFNMTKHNMQILG